MLWSLLITLAFVLAYLRLVSGVVMGTRRTIKDIEDLLHPVTATDTAEAARPRSRSAPPRRPVPPRIP